MLFTTLALPEDYHHVSGRSGARTAGGVRTDTRPPVRRRGERRRAA